MSAPRRQTAPPGPARSVTHKPVILRPPRAAAPVATRCSTSAEPFLAADWGVGYYRSSAPRALAVRLSLRRSLVRALLHALVRLPFPLAWPSLRSGLPFRCGAHAPALLDCPQGGGRFSLPRSRRPAWSPTAAFCACQRGVLSPPPGRACDRVPSLPPPPASPPTVVLPAPHHGFRRAKFLWLADSALVGSKVGRRTVISVACFFVAGNARLSAYGTRCGGLFIHVAIQCLATRLHMSEQSLRPRQGPLPSHFQRLLPELHGPRDVGECSAARR